MAYTTIDDPSAYFTITLYTGNGSDDRSITNSANAGNFKPDWLWVRQRNTTRHHILNDSNRGATKNISTSLTNAESTGADGIQAFETNGFQLGTDADVNQSSGTYVAFQWKVNGGTATATISESGSNPAASVQANTTAGLSIITYTGTGSEGTIAHGLGASPKMIWVKNRDAGEGWIVDSRLLTGNSNGTLHFNTDAEYTSGTNQFGTHSSTNITIKTSGNINTDGQKYVAYVFIPIEGYSKFGKYTGNGNANGTFVYTGFRPAWVVYKNTSSTSNWIIRDNKRTTSGGTNPNGTVLLPNSSNAESTNDSATVIDLLSNGFKIRNTENNDNTNGNTYIYMAFAEHPFVSSKGVPVTAR